MTILSIKRIAPQLLAIGLVVLLGLLSQTPGAVAQTDSATKPFILPFQDPPGPATWLLAQPYGNTVGAFRQRYTTYHGSGGIHFGVDFSAPCGTALVAMADGVVFAVDNMRFGSAPHNLMIDHPELGYATFYGHLLDPPQLTAGQRVKAGEVVALSGDPAETCYGRPHLHLEIRDLAHVRKYNPVLLVEADWDNLALVGPFGQAFEYDLDAPRKWQHLADQPEAAAGGPILNDFANPWPPDGPGQSGQPAPAAAAGASTKGLFSTPEAREAKGPAPVAPGLDAVAVLRQLTAGGCCTQPFWSPNARQVLFIDRPFPLRPAGIWGADIHTAVSPPQLFSERIGFYTSDLAYRIDVQGNKTVIEQLADPAGASRMRWTVPAGGQRVLLSPGHARIAWQMANEDIPSERSMTEIWIANLDGSAARVVATLPRGGLVAWASDDVLVVSGRESLQAREQVLYALSLADGSRAELARSDRLRGGLVSPDGAWLAYFIALSGQSAQNGLWLVRTDGAQRRQLSLEWFGTFKWRDGDRLLVIPFRPAAISHEIWEIDAETGAGRLLVDPTQTLFKVANNDWAVSQDGRYVAFVESRDHNIWLLSLPE